METGDAVEARGRAVPEELSSAKRGVTEVTDSALGWVMLEPTRCTLSCSIIPLTIVETASPDPYVRRLAPALGVQTVTLEALHSASHSASVYASNIQRQSSSGLSRR